MNYDKKTILDNDADIYRQREVKSLKETLSSMRFLEKISYLWLYYKVIAYVVIFTIVLVVSVILTILKPKTDNKLNVTIIDNVLSLDELDAFKNDLFSHIENITNQDQIIINTTLNFNSDPLTEANSRQALVIYLMANDIDILIAPESEMLAYAKEGAFAPLKEELPVDLNNLLSDHLLYATSEESHLENAYGIYLREAKYFNNYTLEEPLVLSIISSSPKKETAIECIRLLF